MNHDQKVSKAFAQVRNAVEGHSFALDTLVDYEADHKVGRLDMQRLTGFFQGLSAAEILPYEDYCEVSALLEPETPPQMNNPTPEYIQELTDMSDSPFLTHREMLVKEGYSAAGFLRNFTMAMFAGEASPTSCSGIRNLDREHLAIFLDLAKSFHANGEGDPEFVATCQAIRAEWRKHAQVIKATLDEVRATDPHEYEGGSGDHAESLRFYGAEHEKNRARGWID